MGIENSWTTPGDDGVELEETDVQYVRAQWGETVIRGRPWVPHKRVATVSQGTRLAVRGQVQSRDKAGCHGKPWYAVLPFGFVCSEHVRATDEAPEVGPALPVDDGRRLPFSYAVVREDDTAQFDDADSARIGLPNRFLTKKMTLVVTGHRQIDGRGFIETAHGDLVAKEDVGWMGDGSNWQGVVLRDLDEPGPLFGWITGTAKVYPDSDLESDPVGELSDRNRVALLDSQGEFRKIGEGAWVRDRDVNEVIILEPPEGVLTEFRLETTGNDQWIDVDTGEQVLVAYRGHRPVYATLISSGRSSPTPLGNYPVWAKVASIDMSNQDYENKPYMVSGVPWVLLFQGHNALHGAYWHDSFGRRKSHGCVNLAPRDAQWVFEWAGPWLPTGWTGYLPNELERSVVVHVRDSHRTDGETFTQERPWGPPDFEEEKKKAQEAAEQRALAAIEAERRALEQLESGDDGAGGPVGDAPAKPPRLPSRGAPTLVPPT